MDPPRKPEIDTKPGEEARDTPREADHTRFRYFWPLHPIRFVLDLILTGLRLVRPLAPQLVPLAVFSITLPVILFFSFSAGWLVWKSVAVGWEAPLYFQYGDGGSPFAETWLPNLARGQPYDVSVKLVVPTNDGNLALGNFMTTLNLYTASNASLASVRKPAIVLPQSAFPFSFSKSWTSDLDISLLRSVTFDTTRVLARVEVGRKDLWKTIGNGEGRELSVLSALVRGVVIHRGIRGLISRFPIVAALTASSVFFVIAFAILATCLIPMAEWHVPEEEEKVVAPPEVADEKPRKRRRSRVPPGTAKTPSRSRSDGSRPRSARDEIKVEDFQDITMPSAATATPLRRRRSQLSQRSDELDT